MSSSEHELSIWEGDQMCETPTPVIEEPRIKVKKELQQVCLTLPFLFFIFFFSSCFGFYFKFIQDFGGD